MLRTALIETLIELAGCDDRVYLLTADLGFTVVEAFAQRYPRRFVNVGVAEQNMIGVATGLAQAGFTPYCYSIATFASMRGYEQIRNGPVLHDLPVRIVGIGGGYAYGHAGPTHHALEDISILRAQPGMTVVVPADPEQTRTAVRVTARLPGPVYLRVGKGANPAVPGLAGRFGLGRPELVRPGHDLLLLATGDIVHEALAAASQLETDRVSAAVAVQAHVSQSPSPELVELLGRFEAVVSVEEGYATGGLGALVAAAIAGQGLGARLTALGAHMGFNGRSGSPSYMRRMQGLDASGLAGAARTLLARHVTL